MTYRDDGYFNELQRRLKVRYGEAAQPLDRAKLIDGRPRRYLDDWAPPWDPAPGRAAQGGTTSFRGRAQTSRACFASRKMWDSFQRMRIAMPWTMKKAWRRSWLVSLDSDVA